MDDIKFRQVKYALVLIIILIVFLFIALDSIGFIKIFNFEEENKKEIIDWSVYSTSERLEAGEVDYDFLFVSGDELEEGSGEEESGEEVYDELEEELEKAPEDFSGEAFEDVSGEKSNS